MSIAIFSGLLLFPIILSSSICSTRYSIATGISSIALSYTIIRAIDSIESYIKIGENRTGATGISMKIGSAVISIVALVIIEVSSYMFRGISLGFRITANNSAGHILLHVLISGNIYKASGSAGLIILIAFELVVSVVQVVVFSLLIVTYAS